MTIALSPALIPETFHRAKFTFCKSNFTYIPADENKKLTQYGFSGNYTTGWVFSGYWFISAGLCNCDKLAQLFGKITSDKRNEDISDKDIQWLVGSIQHSPSNRVYRKTAFEWPLDGGFIVQAWENVADDQDIVAIRKDVMARVKTDLLWRRNDGYHMLYLVNGDDRAVFGIMPINMKGDD